MKEAKDEKKETDHWGNDSILLLLTEDNCYGAALSSFAKLSWPTSLWEGDDTVWRQQKTARADSIRQMETKHNLLKREAASDFL